MLRRQLIIGCAIALGISYVVASGLAVEPDVLRIGAVSTMFRDSKSAKFTALAKAFCSAIEAETGIKSTIVPVPDADDLRRQLVEGKLQLGLFHGFEFAWMRQADPKLRPWLLSVPTHRPLKAFLVVSSDDSAKQICDLRGKTLALPQGISAHANLFAERQCQCDGKPLSQFFEQITTPRNAETALHEVCDGKVQAAVVDSAAMQCFAERFPARLPRLRTLMESPEFPLNVIAVRDGGVDAGILRRLQDAMGKANSNVTGRQIIGLMHLSGFEHVPPEYDQQLSEIMKLFPPPHDKPN